jgi:hypothetical protein
MEQNKTGLPEQRVRAGKYLKYAIGEIVLVVIGILIALSINNWNETQKLIKNEKELITSLKKEITSNITGLNSSLEKNKKFLETSEKLIQSLNTGGELYSAKAIYSAFDYYPYIADSPVLDKILESNSNLLIKKKKQLAEFRLLKNNYSKIIKQQIYLDDFWNSKVTDFFIASGIWLDREEIDYQISLKELALDGYSKKQLITILKLHKSLHDFWEYEKINGAKKSNDILNLLNEEKAK